MWVNSIGPGVNKARWNNLGSGSFTAPPPRFKEMKLMENMCSTTTLLQSRAHVCTTAGWTEQKEAVCLSGFRGTSEVRRQSRSLTKAAVSTPRVSGSQQIQLLLWSQCVGASDIPHWRVTSAASFTFFLSTPPCSWNSHLFLLNYFHFIKGLFLDECLSP